MPQPPKSIIRAPSARWLLCSGVVRGVNANASRRSGRDARAESIHAAFAAGLVGSAGRRGAARDTMRRPATLIGLVLAATLTIPAAAHAATPTFLFPVVGGATYFDDY